MEYGHRPQLTDPPSQLSRQVNGQRAVATHTAPAKAGRGVGGGSAYETQQRRCWRATSGYLLTGDSSRLSSSGPTSLDWPTGLRRFRRWGGMPRETRLASAFVELAEALVTGEEVGDFLHRLSRRAIELLEVDAAGVMLADENDRLRAIAASNEDTHNLEVFALQHQEGVCLDVYRSGKPEQTSTAGTTDRWPHFSQVTLERGYGWVCGVPLRHGEEIIG